MSNWNAEQARMGHEVLGADTATSMIAPVARTTEGSYDYCPWVELGDAAYDFDALQVWYFNGTNAGQMFASFGVDNGSGVEAKVDGLPYRDRDVKGGRQSLILPISGVEGDSIHARTARSNTTETDYCAACPIATGWRGGRPSLIDNIGMNESEDGVVGVTVDCGGTANTKVAWTQLIASTERDYNTFFLHGVDDSWGTSSASAGFLVDVAVYDGADYRYLALNVPFNSSSGNDYLEESTILINASVPKGSEIHVTAQSSVITTTYRNLRIGMHGIG